MLVEPGIGRLALFGQDRAVRQTGVAGYRDVDERDTRLDVLLDPVALGPAVGTAAATVGNPGQLPDVDVERFSGGRQEVRTGTNSVTPANR